MCGLQVVIPDHSVSGEHALIIHTNGEFWLHDRESSNGSYIRLCAPLRLGFGESLQIKMGKSLLSLQVRLTFEPQRHPFEAELYFKIAR